MFIISNQKYKKILFIIKLIKYIISFISAYFYNLLFFFTNNNKIVIGSSNGKYASNNSIELFKFLVNKGEKVVFITDRKCKNIKEIKRIGKVVNRFSFKGNLTVFNSKILIYDTSYHDLIRCPLLFLKNKIKINIFHGIHGLKKISKKNANNRSNNDDYIIASSEYEKNIKLNWGFNKKQIYITGLPRFDNLYNKSRKTKPKNQIFYMPTWRPWFKKGYISPGDGDIQNFINSKYFKTISELANSEQLNYLLKKNNFHLNLFVHKLMHRYTKEIKFKTKNRINILTQDTDIQKEIINSKLLITDYSSVFFDFIFINRPFILFQFDRDKFYNYIPGSYIDKDEIKNKICYNQNELYKLLFKYFNGDDLIDITYNNIANKYVKYFDNCNCKRVYSFIKELEI